MYASLLGTRPESLLLDNDVLGAGVDANCADSRATARPIGPR